MDDTKRTSKFLSLILRHQPDVIGIELDENGWAEIDVLLQLVKRSGHSLTRAQLEQIVANNDKRRFAISDDGLRIRANQGHSVDIDLKLNAVEPPDNLFHGTVEKFMESIEDAGLIPGARQHVHLSADIDTAINVARRRGKPVVLVVDSTQMHADGKDFFCSENGVWLTAHVAPEYFQRKAIDKKTIENNPVNPE